MTPMTSARATGGGETESVHYNSQEIKTFGFWVYLMSDLVIFSILFAVFAVQGHNYAGGPGPKQLFDIPYLFVETMFLLVSSLACGLSVVALQHGKRNQVLAGLIVTFILGLGFVTMEIHEFYGMIADGNGPTRNSFLSSFFTLVGTHGAHVSFGLIWILVMIAQLIKKGLTDGVNSRLMRLGLFWHFLDIVWVGVFTFVYLLGKII